MRASVSKRHKANQRRTRERAERFGDLLPNDPCGDGESLVVLCDGCGERWVVTAVSGCSELQWFGPL